MLFIEWIDCIDWLLNRDLGNSQEVIIALLVKSTNLELFEVESIIVSLKLMHQTR